jgi:hypothetical protein
MFSPAPRNWRGLVPVHSTAFRPIKVPQSPLAGLRFTLRLAVEIVGLKSQPVFRAAALLDSLTLPTRMMRRFTRSQSPSFRDRRSGVCCRRGFASAMVKCFRIVAIELVTWRSGRIGRAAGMLPFFAKPVSSTIQASIGPPCLSIEARPSRAPSARSLCPTMALGRRVQKRLAETRVGATTAARLDALAFTRHQQPDAIIAQGLILLGMADHLDERGDIGIETPSAHLRHFNHLSDPLKSANHQFTRSRSLPKPFRPLMTQ